MKPWLSILGACAAVVCTSVVPASARESARLERVGRDAGLVPEMITAIYQDRAGFLWVGTRQGLFFWDGASFRRLEHQIDDPGSIGDDVIRTVFEDSTGRFWVGTNSAGLDLLDRATWTCTHFRHDPKDEHSIGHDSVNTLAEDRDGTLWVGTQRGLNRFDPRTRRFDRLPADGTHAPRGAYVYALQLEQDGTLWAGTVDGGLALRDPASGSFRELAPNLPLGRSPRGVYAIASDDAGRTWVATDEGVCLPGAGEWTCIREGFANPIVTSLAQGEPGHLWAGTLGGLYDVDLGARRVTGRVAIDSGPADAHALRVVTMARDHAGTLWVGTWENGLQRLREPGLFYSTLLTSGDTTSVLVDHAGRTWVTNSAGELYRRDPGREFALQPSLSATGHGPMLIRMLEDARGHLWLGSSDGLFDLDPQTGTSVQFRNDPKRPGSLGPGYVTALALDRSGTLWVGTGEGGLHRMQADGRFVSFRHDPARADSLSDDYVTAILEDRRGRMFVGTRSGGLNLFERGRAAFRRVAVDPAAPDALGHHHVTALLEDRSGTVWVATGGGVHRVLDRPDGTLAFERITAREGLPDNAVVSLAEDGDTLWIATRGGLARYDRRTGAFRTSVPGEPQGSTEFNAGAVFVTPDRIYFGTVRGLVAVPSGQPFRAAEPSPVVLTALRTLAGPVKAARPVWSLEELSIPYGEPLFAEFAVLDYSAPARHHFSYRITGSEAIDLGESRILGLGKLDPGVHEFVLRGRNAAGLWNETRPLVIRVVPPFWMTTWFRFLVFVAIAALILGAHQVRTASLERRNRELLVLQEQRERALEESRAKEEQLRLAYSKLRQLTRRLELAKEEERKHIALELHDELGQAITAAKIALDMAERESGSGFAGETAALMQRIIERVRDLSLDLRPPLLDERGLAPALRAYVEAQARRSGLAIEIETEPELGRFTREIEMTAFRVVQEAVTNALRHAEAGWIFVRVARTGDGVSLLVRDDGRGFDVSQVLARAEAGSHLGLLGMRERVEALAGTLDCESNPGHGTEIRANLPAEVPA